MRAKLITIFILFILLTTQISVEARSYKIFSELYNDANHNPLVKFNEVSDPIGNNENKNLENVPVAFTENLGQLENDDIRFYAQNGGVWFTDDGVWIEIREEMVQRGQGSEAGDRGDFYQMEELEQPELQSYRSVILKHEFVSANPVQPMGINRLGWNSNFFYGNDSSKWCTGVPNYQEVFFENLYDKIDLRYYSNEKGLKYDFIVHSGANPNQIKMKWNGAEELEIDSSGNLTIKTDINNVIDSNPFIYQDYDNKIRKIEGHFRIYNNLEYGFEILDDYNLKEILIIDPSVQLEYSTYVGGIGYDYSYNIALDTKENAFVSGYASSGFPTTPGANDTTHNGGSYDIFIFKLNPSGSSLIYSTYIGGASNEFSYGITVDHSGNAYVTGYTISSNFPTTIGAYDTSFNGILDMFVVKLNYNGSTLIYSTLIGHTQQEYGRGIDIDKAGNAYVTGYTYSSNFPTTSGAFDTSHNGGVDVLVLKLNPTGSALVYSTVIGKTSSEYGYDIEIDTSGNAYVTGIAYSTDFPTTPGAFDTSHNGGYDSFVLKLNQTGASLVYSTFLGSTAWSDNVESISIDSDGNVIVTGYTHASNFPTTPGAYDTSYNNGRDVFVTKFNHNGSKLIFSTFIGSNGDDRGNSVESDIAGNVIVTGYTDSPNFPVTPDAYDNSLNSTDIFISKFSSNGSKLIYSSLIGGLMSDFGRGLVLDPNGNAYITGETQSSDFPTSPNAYQKTNGGWDCYVTKFSFKPFINISSVSILQNNKEVTEVYSSYCPYTIRVNIIDTANITDFTSFLLTFDPTGSNIKLFWDSFTGKITENSDPKNYITLEPSSNIYNIGYLWTLDFNITFNWNYPDEDLHGIRAYATSKTLSTAWYNRSNFYQVENDLAFNGSLSVTDDDNRTIIDNDLVRGGEKLNWTGLTPVYENTIDVYPPDEVFNISISDENENSWIISPKPGKQIFIETIIPNTTDLDGDEFKLSISEIPAECDKTNESLIIRIDGDNVTFSNESPDKEIWQTLNDVLAGVNIIDYGGGMVDGNTVEYISSINNGSSWSDWNSIHGLTSAVTIIAQDTVTFNEGRNNLIKWRAADSVGNGPTESKQYRILVDTEDVTFSNAWPLSSDISTTDEVEVGITISDEISGVDASTIQYSVSADKGKTWSAWENLEGFEDGQNVVAHINITFLNGTDNILRWRAYDIAGNGPMISPWQMINVNTWAPQIKPKVILLSPPNGVIINKTSVEFNWELEDKTMENVTYNLFIDNETSPKFIVTNIENTSYVIEALKDGEIYYWRVVPVLGDLEGICISGSWWLKIDLSKTEKEKIYKIKINGRDSISLFPGENKSIPLSITNLGESKDTIKLELEGGKLSEYIYFEDYSMLELESNNYALRNLIIEFPLTIKPGNHVIIITVISMNSGEVVKDTHVIEIEIKELDVTKPDSEPNGTKDNRTTGDITKEKTGGWSNEIILFSVVAIVILIILFLALALFINKRKKRAEKELLAPGTFAIKPGTLSSPVITMEQVGGAPAVQQLPGTSATGVTTQPTAVTTPVPTLASTITTTPTPPLEQMPQVPQLPPAQIQTKTPTPEQATPTLTVVTATPTLVTTTPGTPEVPEVSTPTPITTVIPATQIPAPIPTVITTPILAKEPTPQGPFVHLPESSEPTQVSPNQQNSSVAEPPQSTIKPQPEVQEQATDTSLSTELPITQAPMKPDQLTTESQKSNTQQVPQLPSEQKDKKDSQINDDSK